MITYTRDYDTLINKECAIITTNENFLNDTDYRVVREMEGGEPEMEEDKQLRAAARVAIQEARVRKAELEEAKRREEEEERPTSEE